MERARHEFLSRSAFSINQDGRVHGRSFRDECEHLSQSGAATHQIVL